MSRFKKMRRLLARELTAPSQLVYPLAVFVVGHFMFDWIGEPFSVHVLQATGSVAAGVNLNEVISDGHLWAATAHIYLIVSVLILLLLFRWMWARARGHVAIVHLSIAAILIALGMAYIINVDKNARPIKAIFLFTYRSLATSKLLEDVRLLAVINNTLTAINLFMIVVPAVLIAFGPLLVREPVNGWTERELITRIKETHMMGLMASIFLAVGVLHMYAWMSWAPELLNKEGLETVVGSVTFYWGSVFTMMLAAFYFPVLLLLQKRAEGVMDAQQVPLIERDQWLQRRGLSLRIVNQLPQVIGILAPLVAAPMGKLLSSFAVLIPK